PAPASDAAAIHCRGILPVYPARCGCVRIPDPARRCSGAPRLLQINDHLRYHGPFVRSVGANVQTRVKNPVPDVWLLQKPEPAEFFRPGWQPVADFRYAWSEM